jgi:hypothetical protein
VVLERERWLWLRGALWLVPAPGVFALLAYLAAPWFAPGISDADRSLAAVTIGIGSAMCFTALYLIGITRGRQGEVDRAERIWFASHIVSLFAMGFGAVLFGTARASAAGTVGFMLLVGGVILRFAGLAARWIHRATSRRAG